MKSLVLASSSPYRRELLQRLQIDFSCRSPSIDESAQANEAPEGLAARLAQAKAQAIFASQSDCRIIGSDQVASVNGLILGKPGSAERAAEQLRQSSGQSVAFHTAITLLDSDQELSWLDHTTVTFRNLSEADINRYLERENALNCAGSFKAEGLGISLFSKIDSSDPTALIGLPMIALCHMLRQRGVEIP